MKNGKTSVMRCLTAALLPMAVLLSFGCGCKRGSTPIPTVGQFGAADQGIYLYKDLAVQDAEVQAFPEDRYDLEEYKGILTKEVNEYNKKNAASFQPGDPAKRNSYEPEYSAPMTLIKLEVKDGNVFQELLYATAADYTKYRANEIAEKNGEALKAGTLDKAGAEILKHAFVSPQGGSFDAAAQAVAENAGEYRYLYADFSALLYGDGDIIAYSKGAEYDKENKLVKSKDGEPVIVIFR